MSVQPKPSMRLGLIEGEREDEYRASGAIGSTEIRAYLTSPIGYRLRYVDKHPLAQFSGSAQTELGTMVHLLLQGEEHYRARCVIPPPECFTESGARSKAKDARWQFDRIAAAGQIAMSPDDDSKVRFLVDRIRANPVANRLMQGCKAELTGRVIDPPTGLPVQVRFDLFNAGWNCDYKTTSSPLRSFKWAVRDHQLHVQAALYDAVRLGITGQRVPFYWIVQSTVWPFDCRVVECPEALRDAGMNEVDRALTGIAARDWGESQTDPDILEGIPA